MRFCPFAQRTRLVLVYKNIQHETVNVDLKEKPDWFLKRNPLGLVPVLEKDDKIVYESLITCDYLDDVYPDNRLTPADPYLAACDNMLVDYFGNKFIGNYYKFLHTEGKDEEARDALAKALKKMEDEITARGRFFGGVLVNKDDFQPVDFFQLFFCCWGEKLAMVDFMLWPWFERISLVQTFSPSLVPSEKVFPKLFSWIQTMLQQPAVKATCFDLDTHIKYMLSSKAGKPDYNIGLEP